MKLSFPILPLSRKYQARGRGDLGEQRKSHKPGGEEGGIHYPVVIIMKIKPWIQNGFQIISFIPPTCLLLGVHVHYLGIACSNLKLPTSTCTTHLGVKFTPPHHTEMSTGLYSLPEIYDHWFFLFTVRGGK